MMVLCKLQHSIGESIWHCILENIRRSPVNDFFFLLENASLVGNNILTVATLNHVLEGIRVMTIFLILHETTAKLLVIAYPLPCPEIHYFGDNQIIREKGLMKIKR